MDESITKFLLRSNDLHPKGDWWDEECRLPEFSYELKLASSEICPLQIVGRYLTCAIHQDKVVQGMNFGMIDGAFCQELAQDWHAAFSRELLDDRFFGPALRPEDAVVLSQFKNCIVGTMLERLGELFPLCDADGLALLLDTYPELTVARLAELDCPDVDLLVQAVLAAENKLEFLPTWRRQTTFSSVLGDFIGRGLVGRDRAYINEWLNSLDSDYNILEGGRRARETILTRELLAAGLDPANSAALVLQRNEVGGKPQFSLDWGWEDHQIVFSEDRQLICARHGNNGKCRAWIWSVVNTAGEGPGAGAALKDELERLVDQTVTFASAKAKQAFMTSLCREPKVWSKLDGLSDFTGRAFPLSQIPQYLSAGLDSEEVQRWLVQGLAESWQIPVAETLKSLRPELMDLEVGQLLGEWSKEALERFRAEPQALVAATRWQDLGYRVKHIIAQIDRLQQQGGGLELPLPERGVMVWMRLVSSEDVVTTQDMQKLIAKLREAALTPELRSEIMTPGRSLEIGSIN